MKKSLLCMLLLVAFFLGIMNTPTAFAEEGIPYSSKYITSYRVNMTKSGNTINVYFDIFGVGIVNDLGAHTIIIQRSRNGSSWTNIKAFYYTDAGYSHMMGHQTGLHQSYVTYTGTSGFYYRALVKVWGGDGTSGDMFPAYTNVIQL